MEQDYHKKYYAANKEKIKERSRAYHKKKIGLTEENPITKRLLQPEETDSKDYSPAPLNGIIFRFGEKQTLVKTFRTPPEDNYFQYYFSNTFLFKHGIPFRVEIIEDKCTYFVPEKISDDVKRHAVKYIGLYRDSRGASGQKDWNTWVIEQIEKHNETLRKINDLKRDNEIYKKEDIDRQERHFKYILWKAKKSSNNKNYL